jgi:hypothetical protein
MKLTRINEARSQTQEFIDELSQYAEMLNIGMFTKQVYSEMIRDRVNSELAEIANDLRQVRTDSDYDKFVSTVGSLLELYRLGAGSEYSLAIGKLISVQLYKNNLEEIAKVSHNITDLISSWFDRPEVKKLMTDYAKYLK